MEEETKLELSKFFLNSEVREFRRSEIKLADYNPRTIDEEGRKNIRRSLKKFGCVGGIVINLQTGNTVVGGHQKIAIMDEFHKYPDNDYLLRAEAIDVDIATEKTLNITLNNPNVGGYWDYDKMRELVPDIDYKAAGLTEADLNMIGVDFLVQTEGENQLGNELANLNAPLQQEAQMLNEQRKAQREALKQAAMENGDTGVDDSGDDGRVVFEMPPQRTPEEERQAKIDHMKEVKAQVKENAIQNAQNMDAYVMISFDNWQNKVQFCQRFGYDPYTKFIKGEVFDEQVERVD